MIFKSVEYTLPSTKLCICCVNKKKKKKKKIYTVPMTSCKSGDSPWKPTKKETQKSPQKIIMIIFLCIGKKNLHCQTKA